MCVLCGGGGGVVVVTVVEILSDAIFSDLNLFYSFLFQLTWWERQRGFAAGLGVAVRYVPHLEDG